MSAIKKLTVLFVLCRFLSACSGGGASATSIDNVPADPFPDGAPVSVSAISGNNVVPISVANGYHNEPVVTVTVCDPGSTTNCVTIPNVLLDTGSSGLRIFGSLLSGLNLTQVTINGTGTGSGAYSLAKCTYYGDGTMQWGPVKTANVKLGGELVSNVNIQIIDRSYKTVPTSCSSSTNPSDPNVPESSPTVAQYNGILGVGIRDQDCGTVCESNLTKLYYACGASTCTYSQAPLAMQVRNPVAAMTAASNTDGINDSNGTALILPAVPSTGSLSASGYLVFGINTQANNQTTANNTVFPTDADGYMYSKYPGGSYIDAFIDSGSNGLYIPKTSTTPTCSTGWFCPDSTVQLSATMKSYSGVFTKDVTFEIANTRAIAVSNNQAYDNLGADNESAFDWGLPFFYGRTIFTGISGKSSTINGYISAGTPFYAY